jgi:hypothetical protein
VSEPLNLPAEIDLIHRQLDQARDIETVLENGPGDTGPRRSSARVL